MNSKKSKTKLTSTDRPNTNGKASGAIKISEEISVESKNTATEEQHSQFKKHRKGYKFGYTDWLKSNHRREEAYHARKREAKKLTLIKGSISQAINSTQENFSDFQRMGQLGAIEDINDVSKMIVPSHTYRIKSGNDFSNRYLSTEVWKVLASFIHNCAYNYSEITSSISNRRNLTIICKKCDKRITASSDEHLLEEDFAVCKKHGHRYPWHDNNFGKAALLDKQEDYKKLLTKIRFLKSNIRYRNRQRYVRHRNHKDHVDWEEYRALVRRRLNRADENQKRGEAYLLILTADLLNLPIECFTNDTLIIKGSVRQIQERMLSTGSLIRFMDLFPILQAADRLEIQYKEDFGSQLTRDYFGFGDSPRHRHGYDAIHSVALSDFETFFEKIVALHRAINSKASEAREILEEQNIPTGKLRKPKRDFILTHGLEHIEDVWEEFYQTEYKSRDGNETFFPIVDLNLYNVLKLQKFDGSSQITKERVAVLSLHRQSNPRQLVYCSYDTHWHCYRDSEIPDLRKVIANSLRAKLGISDDNKQSVHGFSSDFFQQPSWYRIMFSRFPSILEQLIKSQLQKIDQQIKATP